MNSIRNVQRAIEHEIKRQIDIIESGGSIEQNTRSFDAVSGTTFDLRSKEMANDYRYFPEPDLQPIVVSEEYIEKVKMEMPPLPHFLFTKFTTEFGLSTYDAEVLTENKSIALYFHELTEYTKNYKAAANWIMGAVKSYLNENAITVSEFPLKPTKIAEIIALIDEGKISTSIASQKLFPEMVKNPNISASDLAKNQNLIQDSDTASLQEFVEGAIAKYPEKVVEYKNGKTGLLGLFMGEVMKLSKGKADPKIANELLLQMLNK